MKVDELARMARGRWADILAMQGVPHKLLDKRHHECPFCGGKDRFRFTDYNGDGVFYCNQCGSGDGFTFLERFLGEPFKVVFGKVADSVGAARRSPVKSQQQSGSSQSIYRMAQRWRSCSRVRPGDFVMRYLRARLGRIDYPQCIRQGDRPRSMTAAMLSHEGRCVMLHETFITEDGRKADVDPVRKFFPGDIPDGAAVQLFPMGEDGTVGIAEGIETALAAAKLFKIPVWAALNTTMLRKWAYPPGAKRIVVFGDNDANFAGQSAAYELARKFMGVKSPPQVDVKIPGITGEDWADVLAAKIKAGECR